MAIGGLGLEKELKKWRRKKPPVEPPIEPEVPEVEVPPIEPPIKPLIEEPPVRPPIEPPPILPPVPMEPIDIIGRVYPQYPAYKPEEIPARIAELSEWAEEDPEAFLYDLQTRASEEEVAEVLGLLGYELTPPEPTEEVISRTISDVYPDMTPREFTDYLETDIESFLDDMRTGGMTAEKLDLLNRGMGIPFQSDTELDIRDIFSQIKIVVPIEGIRQPVTITDDGRAYNEKGQWVGTYNSASKEFTEAKTDEGFIKDSILDPLRFAGVTMYHRTKQFYASVVPNILYPEMPDWYPAPLRDFMNETNKQQRDGFRKVYSLNQSDYEDWVVKHPELIPKPEWEEGWSEHPELILNPAYIAYEFSSTAPITLAVMATVMSATAVGNPLLGIAGGMSLMVPVEGADAYEALLDAGAPEDQASAWALFIGTAAGGIEVGSDLLLFKIFAPRIAAIFRKEAMKEMSKATVAHLAKKGIIDFSRVEAIEISEEVLTLAISNAVIKVYDENKEIWDDMVRTAAKTFAAVLPLAVLGGSSTMVSISRRQAGQFTDIEKIAKGWEQDPASKDWFRPMTSEEIVAKFEEGGVIEEVPEVEVIPPVVEEVKPPVEPIEAPERIVYTEAGIPVPPEETISQGVVDTIPILQDIGAKEGVRPFRKIMERLDLYVTYKGIQRAEVELGEARQAFGKKLKEVSNLVDKNRRNLVFRELENPGSVVGLTFNEKRAVNFFRENFNKWADKLNLPPEKRLKNYVTHIFEADIAEQIREKHPLDPAIARALEYKAPKTIFNPFLQKRLGATVGLMEDPFAAASAYEARQLKVLYYEPFLQKISAIANDPNQHRAVRDYLKDYSRRMTDEPAKLDLKINADIQEFAEKIRGLPGGEAIANFLSRGNASGWASYNFTSAIYTLWLGFKPTSAIRNLSQHTLIIGEVGPVRFSEAVSKTLTTESKQAVAESLVMRSRKAAFVPGIDDSFATQWVDKFREVALLMFRAADKVNVRHAFLGGYYEAKHLLPNADRQVWIDRGDEVAADTQYLYTKMNSMAISQTAPGRVFSILTTWSENWMELMVKWVSRRPSQVYLQHEKATGEKVTGANWSTSYKAILMYMLIIGLGFAIKEKTRLKAWEYTGLTSIRYLADIAGGDFPGLQYIGAAANLVAGFVTDDERRMNEGLSQLDPVKMAGILRQLEGVAAGDKDWLTLLFYLEGRDWKIKQLKDKWEKEFEAYPLFKDKEGEYDVNLKLEWMRKHPEQATWSESKIRSQWRIDNPLLEAKMFVVSQFTTLSTGKARVEVLRLIEEHKLDKEMIDGYEKVFGVDTSEELTKFKNRIGNLEKLEIDKEAEYFTVNNFVSEVNEMVKVQGRTKVERDGSPFTIEILRAQDSFVQYEEQEPEGRKLYRQQFPDVEALLYMTGKIQSFENPKSAEILLGLMKKYNIPPEGIRAFVEDPSKYDELFTQKFELEQKWFDQSMEYDNYGNSESPLYIEDKEERKLARDKFKEDNPNWVADMRRIEAIDSDASPEIIERWAERGRAIDEFGAGSSEARVWLIDNPDTFKWALDQKLLTDDGSDWNEAVLRLNVEMAKLNEESAEYAILKRKKEAHTGGFADYVDKYVAYYQLPISGYRQERFLIDNPEFAKAMADIKGIEIPDKVPPVEYDILLEKEDRTPKEDLKLDAYKKFVPDKEVENYVTYYSLKKPEDVDLWYEDDWFLMEHIDFYKEVYLKIQGNQRADFRKVPTREVYAKYLIYKKKVAIPSKDQYRENNLDLDAWLLLTGKVTVSITEKKRRELLTEREKFAEKIAEGEEEFRESLEEIERKLKELE